MKIEINEKDQEKILNLASTILITSRDDLNDFAHVTDRDRLNAIMCFALDMAETIGFSYDQVKRNIKTASPEREEEFSNYMSGAFTAAKTSNEIAKDGKQ